MTDSLPVTKSFNPRKSYPFMSSKFKRRCPFQFFYVPLECPDARNCEDGLCPLSHTKLEVIFHPLLHKTKRCSMAMVGVCGFSQRCAFFHDLNDRVSSHLSWLVWQKKWSLWDDCSNIISTRFHLPPDLSRKLSIMVANRLEVQRVLKSLRETNFLSRDRDVPRSLQKSPLNCEKNMVLSYYEAFNGDNSLFCHEPQNGYLDKSAFTGEPHSLHYPEKDSFLTLEMQLSSMVDSYESPDTTASTLTPDLRTFSQFAI